MYTADLIQSSDGAGSGSGSGSGSSVIAPAAPTNSNRQPNKVVRSRKLPY